MLTPQPRAYKRRRTRACFADASRNLVMVFQISFHNTMRLRVFGIKAPFRGMDAGKRGKLRNDCANQLIQINVKGKQFAETAEEYQAAVSPRRKVAQLFYLRKLTGRELV